MRAAHTSPLHSTANHELAAARRSPPSHSCRPSWVPSVEPDSSSDPAAPLPLSTRYSLTCRHELSARHRRSHPPPTRSSPPSRPFEAIIIIPLLSIRFADRDGVPVDEPTTTKKISRLIEI
ncbi:hypothetical protein PGT21_000165 [Puccinia graminis f. sp. tritici]|uniref:Uncharacterized protein n=1 Tax=Puccinia graminis f. sp. tritici TaxID=56615 RepID=A0A5B0LJ41_PUCGR|nr:hypothetical protein PGT21_000165 [Puccinia graminis f. sp. tritici]